MPLELYLVLSLTVSLAVAYSATPIAIRLADRLEFYDHPAGGYKSHAGPTPYLGGVAVFCAFGVTISLFSDSPELTIPLLGGTLLMCAVGTWDDRRHLSARLRLAIEIALSVTVWASGIGWELGLGPVVDLVVTALWTVAVINAFNIFDNMDGAAPTMGTVAAGGLVVLGVVQGNAWLVIAAAALCGACAGFLPHNVSTPSRIFLGDGGSMPIGFAVATLTIVGASEAAVAWQSLAMGLLFVGVPALDTTLVTISRRRRGVSVMVGGCDGISYRARKRLRTARAVAISLGSAQAIISLLAVVALTAGSATIPAAAVLYLIGAAVVIAVLDRRFVPVEPPVVTATGHTTSTTRRARRRRTSMALIALLPFVVALGAAPFFEGYYDSRLWVPAGIALVVAVSAGVIAVPPPLTRPALLFLGGLAALVALSLFSAVWADSIEDAVTEANRLAVYAALTGLCLIVLRTDAAGAWLVGGLAGAVVVGAGIITIRLLGSDPADLFVGGRLDEPLGYINGQAAFLLLGAWCCLAVAEQRRSAVLAGAGMVGAVLLAALVMLSQSRGVALAALVSVATVLLVVPGRLRRVMALGVVAASVALAGPSLLDVYQEGRDGTLPAEVVRSAARAALVAALLAGVVWAGLAMLQRRTAVVARRVRPLAIAGLSACALLGVGVAVAERASIADSLERQYTSFTRIGELAPEASASTSRLASGSGNRYDYWRIAWRTFEDHPLIGVGAGNYDRPYFKHRATVEDVTQPHSIELQVLSELGLLGIVALAIALAGLAWGAWRLATAARTSQSARLLAVAGVGCVTAWLVHASVDWLHLLPGVTGIALAAAALLLRDRVPARAPSPLHGSPPRRLAPLALVAIALAFVGASLSRQGMAEHLRSDAQDALAERPEEALRQADRALRLDPEATQAYYLKSAALARFGQAEAAQEALREAARREPENFVTWALLGDLAVRTGDIAESRDHYRRALALNPRDPGLEAHLADLRLRVQETGG